MELSVTDNISQLVLDLLIAHPRVFKRIRPLTQVKEHSAYRDVPQLSVCNVFCLLHITQISNV